MKAARVSSSWCWSIAGWTICRAARTSNGSRATSGTGISSGAAVGRGVDRVFHLASVPGGAAEEDFERGLRVNLEATLWLLEALRASGRRPRYVFASTVAVYGVPMPDRIDEATLPAPSLSYGAQKLAAEILAADYAARATSTPCRCGCRASSRARRRRVECGRRS